MRPPAVTAVCSCTYNAKHYNSESYSDMLFMHCMMGCLKALLLVVIRKRSMQLHLVATEQPIANNITLQ